MPAQRERTSTAVPHHVLALLAATAAAVVPQGGYHLPGRALSAVLVGLALLLVSRAPTRRAAAVGVRRAAPPALGALVALGALAPSIPAATPANPPLACLGLVAGLAVALGLTRRRVRRVGVPVGAEVADDSPPTTLEVHSTAVREARGAAVEVNFAFTCAAGRYYALNAFLDQRVGPDTATGSRTRSDRCTGEEQRVTLGVTAEAQPFRAEPTYYRASIVLSPDYSRADLEGELEVVNG